MKDSPQIRTLLAVFGGISAAVLVVAIIAVVNGGLGFTECTMTARTGWVVPLVGGVVIGLSSLALLRSGDEISHTRSTTGLQSSTCVSCGNPILEEWRLCPHCGELLECSTESPRPEPVESRV